MSMNLYAFADDQEIWLIQTPTQITYMCLVQPDGTIASSLTGIKAKHALQIYLQWRENCLSDRAYSHEEYERYKQEIDEELERIRNTLKTCKKLKVGMS